MNIYALISLLTAAVSLFFGFFIFFKKPKYILNKLFLLVCLITALWAFVEYGYRQAASFKEAKLWWKIDIFWPFGYVLLIHFLLEFTEVKLKWIKWTILAITYSISFLFFSLELFADIVTGPPVLEYWGWSYGMPENPILYFFGQIWCSAVSVIILLFMLIFFFKTKDKIKKIHSLFILIGLSMPVLFGILTEVVLPISSIKIPSTTTLSFAIGCIFIGYATWKYKMFEISPETVVENIISTMTDSLILLDPEYNIKSVNRATCKLLGYSERELVGQPISLIFSYSERRTFQSLLARNLLNVKDIGYAESFFTTKSRTNIPVSLSLSKLYKKANNYQHYIGTVCIARDITERKRKDKELTIYRNHLEELVRERTRKLNETNDRYLSLFKDSPIPLMEVNLSLVNFHIDELKKSGIKDIVDYCMKKPLSSMGIMRLLKIMNVNDAALSLFEADSMKELTDNFHKIMKKETYTTLINFLVTLFENKRYSETEGIIFTLKGKPKFISMRLSIAVGSIATLRRVLISIIDITEKKKAEDEKSLLEDQLRQSQKLEAIGTLAGGIAHDFNNLLTGILGYADLIKSEIDSEQDIFKEVEMIEQTAHRAVDLVKQLLSFARKGKKRNVVFEIHVLIEEVISILSHTIDKRIVIKKQFINKPVYTVGDPSQIEQVLMNLAVNARDAMPEGGELTFNTNIIEVTEKDTANYTAFTPGLFIEIQIKDTGSGIPDNIKSRIFEPFFTTKEQGKGTGMGLAVAYGIVMSHGGFMDVESRASKGTNFKLYIPLTENFKKKSNYWLQRIPVSGHANILIVDDEEVVCRVLQRMLNELGYTTETVNNGQEAVDHYKANNENIDLVLIDMIMPKMNGRDCFRALKKINPGIKAVMVTGYIPEEPIQEGINEEIKDIIYKPFSRTHLSEVIDSVLKA